MTVVHHPECPADRAAMTKVRAAIGPSKGGIDGPRARKVFDAIMGMVPAASSVDYKAATIGGVPGYWCHPQVESTDGVILYFHGGGYSVGSAKAYRHLGGQIALRANASVFIPDYRLAPEHPFPAALADAHAAFAGCVDVARDNIALAGDSAGGGLALSLLESLCVEARNGIIPAPVGAAVISAWTDLALNGASMTTRAKADPLSTPASLRTLAGLYLAGHDPEDPRASPLYANLAGLPPVRMHVGQDDILLDDSIRYGVRLEQSRVTNEIHIWEGMTHVFPSNISLLKASNEALDDIGAFWDHGCRKGA